MPSIMVQNKKYEILSFQNVISKNISIHIYRTYDKNKINFIFANNSETNEKNGNLMLEKKSIQKKKIAIIYIRILSTTMRF